MLSVCFDDEDNHKRFLRGKVFRRMVFVICTICKCAVLQMCIWRIYNSFRGVMSSNLDEADCISHKIVFQWVNSWADWFL